MATPAYKGAGQPTANSSGVLGWLSGAFGGGSPAYSGNGQPTPGASGFLGNATPAYKPPPAKPAAPATPTPPATPDVATTASTCPVDPDPFGSDPIAIIVRRQ